MRTGGALLALVLASGCTMARMEGFDALAAQSDRIDITGIPGWMNGSFALGTAGTRGHVRRRALGQTQGDGQGTRFDPLVVTERVARYGRVDFDVSGPEVAGALAGACRYDREEVRDRSGPLTVSGATVPLGFHCDLTRDGAPAGVLEMHARDRAGQPFIAGREGFVRFAGAALGLRSIHGIEGLRTPSEQRMGYAFDGASCQVGAVQLNGSAARLAIPRAGPERQAAIAAGLALALFWDPGDTDD